jgi:hypothetical protein
MIGGHSVQSVHLRAGYTYKDADYKYKLCVYAGKLTADFKKIAAKNTNKD